MANIGDCLASVDLANERIVLDSGSVDGTAEVVQKNGAIWKQVSDCPVVGPQKNRALQLATGSWVFSIDADERVSPARRGRNIVGDSNC